MSPMLYDGGSRNSEGTSARSGVRPTSCSTRQNLLPGPALPAPYARLRRTTLLSALAAHGFVDGQNLVVVQRSADGRIARLDGLAAELKAANVDVIVTFGYPAALAAKKSAKDVPIVGTGAGDPVATGLVDRLRGWPIATIAFYGPNLSQATKVTFGIVPSGRACGRQYLRSAICACCVIRLRHVDRVWTHKRHWLIENPAAQQSADAWCVLSFGAAQEGSAASHLVSEQFRCGPRTCEPLCGRLSVR
jgi:ABC transporter substrate binding protein